MSINIHNPYNKWDTKTSEIINLYNYDWDNENISNKLDIPVDWNDDIELLIYNLKYEIKESVENIKWINPIYTVSYFRNDINDNFKEFICLWKKEDFNSWIFDKYLDTYQSLIELENSNKELDYDFLKDTFHYHILWHQSTQYPWENQHINIIKDVYDDNWVKWEIRRLFQRWLEDGTFKLPIMLEIKKS